MVTLIWRFIRRLLWDEAAGERYGRMLLFLLASLYQAGAFVAYGLAPGKVGFWAAFGAQASSLLLGAGDKNGAEVKQLLALLQQNGIDLTALRQAAAGGAGGTDSTKPG